MRCGAVQHKLEDVNRIIEVRYLLESELQSSRSLSACSLLLPDWNDRHTLDYFIVARLLQP